MRWRGRRIRPHDRNLMVRNVSLILLACVLAGAALSFREYLSSGSPDGILPARLAAGGIFSVMLAVMVFSVLLRRRKWMENIRNRQRLARMLLENNWFESETGERGKRITYFPGIWYRRKGNRIYLTVQISMGRYQEHLLQLEEKIGTGLDCELAAKETKGSRCFYEFITDVENERIGISDVRAEHGRLVLMRHIVWDYDRVPHALIAGGTGSGKTFFLLSLIEAFAGAGAGLSIIDPKNADLAGLGSVLPDVFFRKEDIMTCLSGFRDDMLARSDEMRGRPDYAPGRNYAAYGHAARFLFFDEYVAFMDMLDKKEAEKAMSLMKQIVMLGRQAGFFIVLACQRPDAKYLGEGLRDQFGLRVALGSMSDSGYTMMFGSTERIFVTKETKGRGYISTGGPVITEFYAPLVPETHDFFSEIPRKAAGRPENAPAGGTEWSMSGARAQARQRDGSAVPEPPECNTGVQLQKET